MEAKKIVDFQSLTARTTESCPRQKTLLIPEMNRTGAHLLAATFRGFGVDARVIKTYEGLDLGMEYTSGKECYPCQVTMGDILHYIEKEKESLGGDFEPENYIYLMPESDGPCRFGMYNKYQRLVLDSFPGLSRLKIVSPTTRDAYSLEGLLGQNQEQDFRKVAYFSMVVADILDRLLWRVRPYEKEAGMTDDFIEGSMRLMEQEFATYGSRKLFGKIMDKLEEIVREGKAIINPDIKPKPLIGIVGEIYLRMHVHANQDLIRTLERHGAEVVNASLAEWVNYISYDGFRIAKRKFRLNLKQLRLAGMRKSLKNMISFGGDLLYKEFRQRQVYKRIKDLIDIAEDHKVAELEHTLKEGDLFNFDLQTEACLSIATIVDFTRGGYNGVVNVYPFTCMPGMTTSTIVKPFLRKLQMPFLDVAYDSSIQPGREAEIRTFMYQACQHFKNNGRKRGSS
jgi:predicted nucleotide-binding protein (sugar kinase/HSP70/actin superfamily)